MINEINILTRRHFISFIIFGDNHKSIIMRNYFFYLTISIFLVRCNQPEIKKEESNNEKIRFEKNWKSFEKHHVGGVESKSIDLFSELYSDTLKWSPPNWNNNQVLGKKELLMAAKNYMDNFENLKFTPGGAVIGGEGAYWAGSTFSDAGNSNSSPDAIRIYGVWSGNHIETGAPFHLKFYAIQQFNKDGKVVMLNEWFDPSSLQLQIEEFLKSQE